MLSREVFYSFSQPEIRVGHGDHVLRPILIRTFVTALIKYHVHYCSCQVWINVNFYGRRVLNSCRERERMWFKSLYVIWEREGVFPLNIHLFIYPFSFVLFIYTLITIIVGCCSLRLDKNCFLNMYKGYIWSNRSGFFYQTGEQIFFVSNPSPFKTMFYESI